MTFPAYSGMSMIAALLEIVETGLLRWELAMVDGTNNTKQEINLIDAFDLDWLLG